MAWSLQPQLALIFVIPADWTLSLTGISSWASGHGLWSGGHSPLYQDYYQTTLSTRNPTLCTKFKEKSRYAVTHILLKNVVHVTHNGNGKGMLVNKRFLGQWLCFCFTRNFSGDMGSFWILLFQIAIMRISGQQISMYLPSKISIIVISNDRIENGNCISDKVQSWFTFLSSSAKQREMTKFHVVWSTWTAMDKNIIINWIAAMTLFMVDALWKIVLTQEFH